MPDRPRIGFVMEQTLGHVTHDRNLRSWAAQDAALDPVWMPVEFSAQDRWQKMPGVRGNWSLRASLRARDAVKAALREQPLDALFFHTQVTALFASRLMRNIPTVVSMDATPINVDSVGSAYDHQPSGNARIEALKNALNRRSFRGAKQLITWCQWAKDSLVRDYGVEAGKVTVIPPGVDLGLWTFAPREAIASKPVRLLFVGGDFRRKGGATLLEAYRTALAGHCELDIVTREEVDTAGLKGVRVHHGLTANAPELMALYAQADLFIFPTLGDCLPIAVMEAMAAGLPVVAACVGALDEEVVEGKTGLLVPPGEVGPLVGAVCRLVGDGDLRAEMGIAARRRAEERFCGRTNYGRVIEVMKGLAK